MANEHVFNIISTHNGSPLSADDIGRVHSEITEKLIGLVLTSDTQSPFRFIANITENVYTERTGADTYRQKASGKTVIFRVLQEAKNNNFRLELSLNISNGNDQDTWGLFDTANIPHTSDYRYNMSLIREDIIVDSVEGKITVNSLQMQLPAPNLEVAKRVADEAQRLIDIYGYYNFLNLVEFMKQNPSMVQMGLSLINKNNAVWKK